MQADEDVGKIAQATPVVLGRAVELFLKQLCEGAIDIASSKNARTLSAAHMKAYVMSDPTMDFLKQTVAGAPDLVSEDEESATKPKRRRKNPEEGPGSPKAGKGRGRGKKGGVKEEDGADHGAEDAPAEVKDEEVLPEVPTAEGMPQGARGAAEPAKQEDTRSSGGQNGRTEQKPVETGMSNVQACLPAAPILPIGIPAAVTAAIAEEDDYDDYD
ncbi:g3183 [Coccomyxa elongata]